MRKRTWTDEHGRKITETTFDASDGEVAKIASGGDATIIKREQPPKMKRGRFKLTDLSANDQAFAASLMNEKGLSLEEVERRFSKSVSHLAAASFDGAKASGASDSDAAKSATLSILKSRPEPTMADLETRVAKSKNGWTDFEKEADLLRQQYGLPATEAWTLARKTFEPVAA